MLYYNNLFSRGGRTLKQNSLIYVSIFKFSMRLVLSPEKCWEPTTSIESVFASSLKKIREGFFWELRELALRVSDKDWLGK